MDAHEPADISKIVWEYRKKLMLEWNLKCIQFEHFSDWGTFF